MGLENAFVEFGRLLRERLSLGVFTTEDTIRYTPPLDAKRPKRPIVVV